MTGATVWRRKSEVAYVESPGRVALLDLDHLDRPPLILEGSAAVIWQLLERPCREDELVEAVAAHFGEPSVEVEMAVEQFLKESHRLGLIEFQPAVEPVETTGDAAGSSCQPST